MQRSAPFIIGIVMLLAPIAVRAQVVISEILWMGSDLGTSDEWLELVVPCVPGSTCADVDISGWYVQYMNSSGLETAMLSFASGTVLSASQPLVVARKDAANSRLDREPGVVSTAVSLPNTKLLLRLFTASGTLVDTVDDGVGAPFAGQNPSGGAKASMERIDLFAPGDAVANWRTATQSIGFDAGAAMFGTPGTVHYEMADPSSGSGSIVSPPEQDEGGAAEDSIAESVFPDARVLLSRVLVNPAGKDELGEWIELRNLGDSPAALRGWTLLGKGSSLKAVSLDVVTVEPHATVRLSYSQTQLLLTNSKYTISLANPFGAEVSAVSWEDASEDRVYRPNLYSERTVQATVSRVIDGDTVEVVFDEPTPDDTPMAIVRLLGIDAPESVHPTRPTEPYGIEASNALRALLEKKKVELQFDTTNWDSYERLLAYIVVDGQVLAQERLLANGLARVYPNYPFSRRGIFEDYEARAKALQLGVWSLSSSRTAYSLVLPSALASVDTEVVTTSAASSRDVMVSALSGSGVASDGWGSLSITEVFAHPPKGDAEWLELFNSGAQVASTRGLRLRIGSGPKAKIVRFPDALIAPGSRTVFSGTDMKLTLRDAGNALALVGTGSVAIFSMQYPKLKTGQSWTGDAHAMCVSFAATPGQAGSCGSTASSIGTKEVHVAAALPKESRPTTKTSSTKTKASANPFSEHVMASLQFPSTAATALPALPDAGPWQVLTFLLACVSLIQGALWSVVAWKSGLVSGATKLRAD